jgi:hypothetical protein
VPWHAGVTQRVHSVPREFGEGGKEVKKKLRNKKIIKIHDKDYFLKWHNVYNFSCSTFKYNLITHFFNDKISP